MKKPKKVTILKSGISLVAIIVIAGHVLWPALTVDAITLGLLILAVLPWLTEIIKSAEFPGGWKIEFQDIKDASEKATGGVDATVPQTPQPAYSFLSVASQDANLALAGLRIEIERRLRALAEQEDVNPRQPLSRLIRQLQKKGTLSDISASGLSELVHAGNRAVHGADVDDRVADWAFEYGPKILASLQTSLIYGAPN